MEFTYNFELIFMDGVYRVGISHQELHLKLLMGVLDRTPNSKSMSYVKLQNYLTLISSSDVTDRHANFPSPDKSLVAQ